MIRLWLSRCFFAVYRFDRWLRWRFTDTGLLLLGMALVAAVFGVDTRATLSHQVVILCISVLAFSMLCAIGFRVKVAVRRQLPRYATIDQTVHYSIQVTNQGSQSLIGLELEERVAATPPSMASFQHATDREGRHRNWFDRRMGYHRWVALVAKGRGVRVGAHPLGDIPPGKSGSTRICVG